jgi:FMN-dependent NADH-azoreductase
MDKQALNALLVTASARQQDSVTRQFANELIQALHTQHGDMNIQERDVSQGLPFVDEQWVNANFTAGEQRNAEQQATLAYSDTLVTELQQSDVIIIAAPVYNFSVPASLKAWIDQIARVGLTFNYTANGPVGKLTGKKAYIVMSTGGTELGSEIDFASGYLTHILGFIGIDDVSIISAERFNQDDEQGLQNIRTQIQDLSQQAA